MQNVLRAARAVVDARNIEDLAAAIGDLAVTLKDVEAGAEVPTPEPEKPAPPPFGPPARPLRVDEDNLESVMKGIRQFYWRQYQKAGSGTHYFFWLSKQIGITFETIPEEMSVEDFLTGEDA